ncbi:MAG: FtsX-like permease family protein [Tetrasphaera sp.]
MRPDCQALSDAQPIAYLREAFASARSQTTASALVILVLAGLVVAVSLTTGRAAAAQRQILAVIDDEDTRSIMIRATVDAGVAAHLVTDAAALSGASWALGVGPARDGVNARRLGDVAAVGVRAMYASSLQAIGVSGPPAVPGAAYANREAERVLGFIDGVGGVTTTDGTSFSVVGRAEIPPAIDLSEPLVLAPVSPAGSQPLTALLVRARTPADVAPLMRALSRMVTVDDPSKVTVESSARLAALRADVDANLTSYGRSLLLLILTSGVGLVTIILSALVFLRRRDFGRRRALGATRGMIVGLLLLQVALLSVAGLALGAATTVIVARLRGLVLPGADFFAAVGVLTLVAALTGAVIPAALAARREPLKELRTP